MTAVTHENQVRNQVRNHLISKSHALLNAVASMPLGYYHDYIE
jgi:hypothetical protein